jgi:transposase
MPANNGNRARVIEMLQRGLTYAEISQETGLQQSTVGSYAAWGRAKGMIMLRTRGRPELVISRLSPEIAAWLRGITPDGATVEDTIRAIVVDAYLQETGPEH